MSKSDTNSSDQSSRPYQYGTKHTEDTNSSDQSSRPYQYGTKHTEDTNSSDQSSRPYQYGTKHTEDTNSSDQSEKPYHYSTKPTKDAQNDDFTPKSCHRYDKPMRLKADMHNQSNDKDAREWLSQDRSMTSQKPVRKCIDCKNPPQMQCLHCSRHVCMECAQKHVVLATEQVDVAQHALNDKMSIIDRLSAAAKKRVDADLNKIIKQADTERNQAYVQIDQFAEQQKKQIRDKNTQLSELSLDEIPSFIQRMTSEMEYLNEANNQLFHINTTWPKIQVQQRR